MKVLDPDKVNWVYSGSVSILQPSSVVTLVTNQPTSKQVDGCEDIQ